MKKLSSTEKAEFDAYKDQLRLALGNYKVNELAKFIVKDKGIEHGFGESTISGMIKEDTYRLSLKTMRKKTELLLTHIAKFKKKKNPKEEKKGQHGYVWSSIKPTLWAGYFFQASASNSPAKLGRCYCEFKTGFGKNPRREVFIETFKPNDAVNYKGEILDNDIDDFGRYYQMYLNLRGYDEKEDKKVNGYHIHIKLRLEPRIRVEKKVLVGKYLNMEFDTITTGTIIFHEIDQYLPPILLDFNDKEFQTVPLPIRKFLSNRYLNYSKIPISTTTLERLEGYIRKPFRKSSHLFFDADKPIVFISTPDTHIDDKLGKEGAIREFQKAAKIRFKGRVLIDSHYLIEEDQRKPLSESDLEMIRHASIFVFIYLSEAPIQSGAFVELGIALASAKKVLIYVSYEAEYPQPIIELAQTVYGATLVKKSSYSEINRDLIKRIEEYLEEA